MGSGPQGHLARVVCRKAHGLVVAVQGLIWVEGQRDSSPRMFVVCPSQSFPDSLASLGGGDRETQVEVVRGAAAAEASLRLSWGWTFGVGREGAVRGLVPQEDLGML